jgi:hypothetical protein
LSTRGRFGAIAGVATVTDHLPAMLDVTRAISLSLDQTDASRKSGHDV